MTATSKGQMQQDDPISLADDAPPAGFAPVRTFEDLYRDEAEGLVRVAFLLLGNVTSAEEVVQDAFVKLHVRFAKVANPGGYLRTSVVNGCRDRLRRRARLARRMALIAPTTESTDASDAAAGELHDVLLRLPLRQRTAIVGRYYCGWDDATIAHVLGARPATVRSLIHRGLAALRNEVKP